MHTKEFRDRVIQCLKHTFKLLRKMHIYANCIHIKKCIYINPTCIDVFTHLPACIHMCVFYIHTHTEAGKVNGAKYKRLVNLNKKYMGVLHTTLDIVSKRKVTPKNVL